MAKERLVFRRKRGSPSASGSTSPTPSGSHAPQAGAASESAGSQPRRHPLFGILKGKFTLAPGTDLTQPADPDWGKELYGD
ncbi:hypothetical protein [Blastochloris tepida]|nr:hypothetical protein [Blastochloris tepida]